jgi:hypothetical protein
MGVNDACFEISKFQFGKEIGKNAKRSLTNYWFEDKLKPLRL